jgi:hypothetical protein
MCSDVPYFIVLLCLTHWAAMHPTYFFYLSNARWFYSSMGKLCSLMGLTKKSHNASS